MKFLERIASKYLNNQGWNILTGGARGEFYPLSVPEQLQEYKGWLYATGNAIADDVKMIKFVLKQRRGNDEVVIMRHPLLDLLQKPHEEFTRSEVLKILAIHIFLTGKAFWHLNRPTGALITEINPLYVDRVEVVKSRLDYIDHFKYYNTAGQQRFEKGEVLCFRDIDPTDFFNGVGVVQALSAIVQTENEALIRGLEGLRNMAMPGGLLMSEKKMSKPTMDALARAWRDYHKGSSNSGRIAVLDQGAKFQPIAQTGKDVELIEGRKYNEHTIRGTARVPGAALGIEATSNRSTAEANDYTFAKRVVKPIMQTIVDAINHKITPDYGSELYLDYVDPIPPDKEFNLRRQTESVKIPWKKQNEARAEAGLPPVDGGDTLYIPNNFTPIDQAGQPNQPASVPNPTPQGVDN